MPAKQIRYTQTIKGKVAQQRAVANYKSKLIKWEALLEPEMADALERVKPDGMSRQAFIKKILQQHLDEVSIPDRY